jgi:hypothetical protein
MTAIRRGKPVGARWWRLRRNPLRRRSYLVEAWLLLAAWTLAVLAAVGAGVLTACAVEQELDGLRAERHAVPAALTENAERTMSSLDGGGGDRAWATVRWTAADGTTRTGVTRAGSTTRVWLDEEGRLMPEPATPDQAELQGAVLGAVAAVSAGAVVCLAGWAASSRVDRRRLAQWDTEWALVGPEWGRKAG